MEKIIEVKELVKDYKETRAVNKISFSVDQGSFFAFLGINGAGKSTTINILCTVLEKTSGTVKIGGYDLDKDKDKIRNMIGIVFQGSVLDKQLSIRENLESRASLYGMTKKDINKRVNELSRVLDLEDILKRPYGKLSGGQRRRVDIARALINKPEILFLDEPTTGLDPQTRAQVWRIIHNLRKETGLTVFLTTHYMEETLDCDSIVILDSGNIVANDTPHNLKDNYSHSRLIWYTDKSGNNENILNGENLEFEYVGNTYNIKLENLSQATNLISKYKEIDDYEVVKGNMDDVFLNVTGKKLGD